MAKKSLGYISVSHKDKTNSIREEFKGIVSDEETMFPKGLGAKHPFNFEDLEKVYARYGVLAGALNKIVSSVVTDFRVKVKNPNAQQIIDDFLHDTNFHVKTGAWVREGLLKGNGFMELDLKETNVRVMNANNMFVKRNKKGEVKEYNQWTKSFKAFNKDSPDLVSFKPNQIAHLPINKIPNDPYGVGIVWSSERIIENLIANEQDLQKLITRKAGQPYHVKVGQPGVVTPQGIVDDIKNSLQFLNNSTEWVTDGDVDIKVLDFPGIGKNITEAQMYFFRMLLAGLEVPEVMMGSGQLNEGIAKVQLKAYSRKIKSIQNQVSDIIEEQIIRPLLIANNLNEKPTFVWDLPDEEDIANRLLLYKDYLNSNISAEMRASFEIKIADLLEDEELLKILKTPITAQEEAAEDKLLDQENEERRKEEEEIPQPEVPSVKPSAQSTKANRFVKSGEVTVKEWIDLKELAGFNYTDYLVEILKVLNIDKFKDLKAITEQDILDGLLIESDIVKLKSILKDGFKENQTIKEIEESISKNIDLKDRVTTRGFIAATNRPNMIARTETVRLANQGLLNLYEENKIEKVSFLAALSDRTCPICEGLNGKVFNITESQGVIPVHSNCRCTWISIIE